MSSIDDRGAMESSKRESGEDGPEHDPHRPRWARSLENGLDVLSHFEDENVVLGDVDLARLTGLSPSTAHKCLVTLSALGYLTQTLERRYRLADISQRVGARRGEHGTQDAPA